MSSRGVHARSPSVHRLRLQACQQDAQDEEDARQEAQAEPAHSPVDSHANWQPYSVRLASFCQECALCCDCMPTVVHDILDCHYATSQLLRISSRLVASRLMCYISRVYADASHLAQKLPAASMSAHHVIVLLRHPLSHFPITHRQSSQPLDMATPNQVTLFSSLALLPCCPSWFVFPVSHRAFRL